MESSGGEKPEAAGKGMTIAEAIRRLRERRARAAMVAKQSAEYAAGREIVLLKQCVNAAKRSELQSRRLLVETFIAAVLALEFGNLFLVPRLGIQWLFICLAVGVLMVIAGIVIVRFSRVPEILFWDWIWKRKRRAFLEKVEELGLTEIRRNYHINVHTGSVTPRKSKPQGTLHGADVE